MLHADPILTPCRSDNYREIRDVSVSLISELRPEDTVVQSMADVSPSKWHLAHVTWFFEQFVLQPHLPDYTCLDERYHYLFNSYYYSAGDMHTRAQRGVLSRPTLRQVLDYRDYVDAAMIRLLRSDCCNDDIMSLVTLGLHHEQQHQELLLTDIKHVLSCNPMQPTARYSLESPPADAPPAYAYSEGESGIQEIGAVDSGFCFDNETPRHTALLKPHRIGNRLITNGEYRAFIEAGGYKESQLWLSDGWATINEQGWNRPLYWSEDLDTEFTLGGTREIDDNAPVCHVSFYEADAFARWSGARLPTEFEWERAATGEDVSGNLLDQAYWHPVAGGQRSQLFGDVWEWTSSPYSAYPGFRPLEGTLGEYNGKFMCNQMAVRGGSCVTPADHIRPSYRSFFYPDARWQFLGFRLALDGHE